MNRVKSKEININLLYEVPSNQTPDELVRIDSSLASLKQEIKKLNQILELQECKIEKITKDILKTQQENQIIQSEIEKEKLKKKRGRFSDQFFVGYSKTTASFKTLDSTGINLADSNKKRIENMTKIIKKNDEELCILDKRLKVAETLLGLRIIQ
jgi:hypothetical protein